MTNPLLLPWSADRPVQRRPLSNRLHFHRLLRRFPRARLVRVNLREPGADDDRYADRVIPVAAGARAALLALRERC